MMECGGCGKPVKEKEGMVIVNMGNEEEDIYCKPCLRKAVVTLSMKGNKTPDEYELLQNIREFLEYQEN